jgi:hypothetical protein
MDRHRGGKAAGAGAAGLAARPGDALPFAPYRVNRMEHLNLISVCGCQEIII